MWIIDRIFKRLYIKRFLILILGKIRWNNNLFNDDIVFLLIEYFSQVWHFLIVVKQYVRKLTFGDIFIIA
jgi:hypothetical protein